MGGARIIMGTGWRQRSTVPIAGPIVRPNVTQQDMEVTRGAQTR